VPPVRGNRCPVEWARLARHIRAYRRKVLWTRTGMSRSRRWSSWFLRGHRCCPGGRLEVAAGGTLSLTNISVRNGSTAGLGGGIQNAGTLMLNQVTFSGNKAGNGGAVAITAGATASIFNTLFDENTTTGVGGGGIINSGMLTLTASTLSGNTAPINGGGLNTQAAGTSRITLSTFVHNVSGSLGGGMSNLGTTSIHVTRVQLNTDPPVAESPHQTLTSPAEIDRHEQHPR
jgi:hypothetical protein